MKKCKVTNYSIFSILTLLIIEQGLETKFRKNGLSFLHFRKINWHSWIPSLIYGVSIMSIIIFAFIVLRPFINLDALLLELANIGVTTTVFPFVALYILFGNSLLEEFFFRGFLPSSFSNEWLKMLTPSLLFALYHITIFLTWFSLPLLIIAIIGLWIGGIIFQLVNKRSKTILPSWTIHVFADAGILLIGAYLFYFY